MLLEAAGSLEGFKRRVSDYWVRERGWRGDWQTSERQ